MDFVGIDPPRGTMPVLETGLIEGDNFGISKTTKMGGLQLRCKGGAQVSRAVGL